MLSLPVAEDAERLGEQSVVLVQGIGRDERVEAGRAAEPGEQEGIHHRLCVGVGERALARVR